MTELPAELRALVATADEITRTVVAAHVEEEDREARWPAPAMRALAEARLTALQVPRAVGGHGQGLTGLVAIADHIARESASTAICFAMHCVGSAVIAAKATPDQTERYLVPIARGEHLTTLALSEPGSGSIFFIPETTLTREGDHYVVRGTKSFVTNGGHVDSYVLSTAAAPGTTPESEPGAFSCVLVDAGTPGLEWQEPWHGLGMRGNSSRTVKLADAPVPLGNLLGAEGDQLWYIFEVVAPYFLMAMAGTYLGVAQAAFEEARVHLGTRRFSHSGELLGSQPVPAHRLGELWMAVESARQLVYSAALQADAGHPDSLAGVLAAKAAASEAAVQVTNEAMTLCGGMAYRENGRLARMLRDARASHVMAPTTDILKTWLGRALLKLPLI